MLDPVAIVQHYSFDDKNWQTIKFQEKFLTVNLTYSCASLTVLLALYHICAMGYKYFWLHFYHNNNSIYCIPYYMTRDQKKLLKHTRTHTFSLIQYDS